PARDDADGGGAIGYGYHHPSAHRGAPHRIGGRRDMLKEFREFLFRGNVVDLAVAVVIGAAFTSVVNSLVTGVITPLVGIFGAATRETWSIAVGPASLQYGLFLTALLNFAIVAAIIFFLVVKPMNAIRARRKVEEEAAPAGPTEIELLTQIRDELAKR